MTEKLKSFEGLRKRKQQNIVNPQIVELKGQLKAVEGEIEKLVDSLSHANDVLISYVNKKIEELDMRRKTLNTRIAELSLKETPSEQIEKLTEYLELWDRLTFQDKRRAFTALLVFVAQGASKIQFSFETFGNHKSAVAISAAHFSCIP